MYRYDLIFERDKSKLIYPLKEGIGLTQFYLKFFNICYEANLQIVMMEATEKFKETFMQIQNH